MPELEGSGVAPQTIDIYGVCGEFSVAHNADDEQVTVKYFSTMASSEPSSASGNTLGLLKELKPMRERVKASEIEDLKTLLQRDLNDYRVANELVPYLQGKFSQVGFFPAVLVAVMPKGFLQNQNVVYPGPTGEPNEDRFSYGGYWSLLRYRINQKLTSLGALSIAPDLCDLVVLDGQHRANAFRYMAGALPENFSDSIYGAFYPRQEANQIFNAELPVTIIWFESQAEVQPSFVTRKLFVDVNTNAKPVSESRNILLDDHDLCSVAVTNLYSEFASEGFSTSKLSLLHSGFDCEDTIPRTALFSPRVVIYSYKYLLMSNPEYDALGKTISSDFVETFSMPHRLSNFFDPGSPDIKSELKLKGIHKLPQFDAKLKDFLNTYVFDLLNDHPLCHRHVEATKKIEEEIYNEMSATCREVWRDIYCGGEGLYGAIMDIGDQAAPQNINTYKEAIREIDERFKEKRAEKFDRDVRDLVSQTYNTVFSKAGITGYLMAASYLASLHGWSRQLINEVSDAVRSVSDENLIRVFSRFKNLFEPELNPKLWPAMRNLYLRIFEEKMNLGLFLTDGTIADYSPDAKALAKSVDRRVKSFFQARTNEEQYPDMETQESWVREAVDEIKEVVDACGLGLLVEDEDVYLKKARGFLNRRLDAYRDE